MYILQQKIKGPASPNALLHSLPSRGFHRGQARLKPPTPKCIKMLVCICIFLGKDSSAVTHSWKSLPSQNLEELQSFSSPRGEDISYPPPQQPAVGGGGSVSFPHAFKSKSQRSQVTGCRYHQGHGDHIQPLTLQVKKLRRSKLVAVPPPSAQEIRPAPGN